MASASTWERIERRKLRQRERWTRPARRGDRPDPSCPAGTDMLPQIKHIVVLMMENHSFDNYLGTLGRGEGFPLGDDGTPDAENPDSAAAMITAHHASSTVQQDGVPCQSWSASHTQWAGGKMNGFVTSAEQAAPEGNKTAAMAYWTDQDLPFYHGLARTFPLADHWFSSCLGPTFPNRRFLLAGTANGLMDDLPFNLLDRPRAGTIMDMLTRHGISWVNYRPAGRDHSEFRRYLRYRHRRNRHHLASLGRPLRKTSDAFKRDLQFTSAIYPLGMASYMAHVRSIERFLRHLRFPGARRDPVPLRAAGLRPAGHIRPHLGARAHRGEVESARANPARRGGDLASRRAGPDGSAGLPDAAAVARAGAGVGHLVGRHAPGRSPAEFAGARQGNQVNPDRAGQSHRRHLHEQASRLRKGATCMSALERSF